MTLGLKGIGYAAAALALAFALSVDSARADVVTYTYVGADFTNAHAPFTMAENLPGTISFSAPLAANLTVNPGTTVSNVTPAAFSFTAGPETLTSAAFTPSFTSFQFSTDAAGNITGWDIVIGLSGGGQININNFSGNVRDQVTDSGSDFANVVNKPGQFTLTAAVPEPSTWAMMILGFVGLGFMAVRRKATFRAA
jgi:PEP-CTERM motif